MANTYTLEKEITLAKPAKDYLEKDFEGLIESFLKYLNDESIEIYNEDSLKFELGTFLRIVLKDYHVCFEKNVSCFSLDAKTIKHEIDITIYPKEKNSDGVNYKTIKQIGPGTAYAIELKFPSFKLEKGKEKWTYKYNNGTNRILEELETDIKFVEELVNNGFKNAWSFVLVPEIAKTIYQFTKNSKKEVADIYYKFREYDNQGIKNNEHDIIWLEWKNKGKYYIKSGCKKKKQM